jgi:hypothetical protein
VNTALIHTVRRDAVDISTSEDLGVLTIYRHPIFSIGTRDLICADFRTPDGQYSQVCKPLRGQGFYVRGSHGDNAKLGIVHPSIEAAVDDALTAGPPDEDGSWQEGRFQFTPCLCAPAGPPHRAPCLWAKQNGENR